MNNIFNSNTVAQFKELCGQSPQITIVSHTNPDGDALGSGLALLRHLKMQGAKVRFFVPNNYPDFLHFIDPNQSEIEVFNQDPAFIKAYIAASDMIICVDFNQVSRLEGMTHALECNIHAKRVLIDHHIAPPLEQFDLAFSDTSYSSTALMICDLVRVWNSSCVLSKDVAEAMYLGMMTDTGCFSYGNLTPELYRAVADIAAAGVDVVDINRKVFDNHSEHRVRMVGYLLSQKMVVNKDKSAAYITLTMQEKQEFHHQIGDTEGIVNMPLSIKGINFSAILIENEEGTIKISLRSQGDGPDVNVIGREWFAGGGHRNAAGGRLSGCSMDKAIQVVEEVIANF